LRVLSFNVNSGYSGPREVMDQVRGYAPDVVLLQEALNAPPFVELMKQRYPHVHQNSQFVLGSRYPILSTRDPGYLPYQSGQRSPRSIQNRIQTPLGTIAFYNVHPISPRGVLQLHRVRGSLHALRTGASFAGDAEGEVAYNAGLRALQIRKVIDMARDEKEEVVIAGDTNLPGLSWALRGLSDYQDGFRAASWGLGYTYPTKYPWLRLDRIFASGGLRFVSFEIGCKGFSDHLCVVADLQRR